MATQNLAYQISVNDAQLRLATKNVAAFNAELAASTVTGRKVDEQMRSVGRRSSQVGNFFTRNFTLPIVLAGVATAKMAADFQTSLAKIHGITNTTAKDTRALSDAMLSLGSHTIITNFSDLADAAFELQSVGFHTNQTIKALGPIAKTAAAGLGSIRDVADAVASSLDAYGIAGQDAGKHTLTANQAVAVLIGTVNAGKLRTDELARSIGRIIPLANAMGISFDQVGGGIASLSRQGLNANLAVTGLRALFSQIARAQPTTQKALAAIGTSTGAVQAALADPKIGLISTAFALRQEFDKLGKVKIDNKTLVSGLSGSEEALLKIKSAVGEGNEALSHAFPNIRALTAFLILTGPRKGQNATIFAQIKSDVEHSQLVIRRAYNAKLQTDIGRFQLAVTKLRVEAIKIGPTFIRAGASILGIVTGIGDLFHKLGPIQPLLKGLGIGLLVFGPLVALFGRATQAASFGVFVWGRWQEAATRAAYAAHGITIAEDEALIAQRKATVSFVEGANVMAAAANRTAAAVANIGRAATGVRGALATATGGSAFFGKVSGGKGASTAAAVANAAAVTGVSTPATSRANVLASLAARRAVQSEAALGGLAAAATKLEVAQRRLASMAAIGATGQTKAAVAEVAQAKASVQAAEANYAQAKSVQSLLFQDEKLLVLSRQLALAQAQQVRFTGAGAPISASRAAAEATALQSQILLRQQTLAGGQLGTTGGFLGMSQRAREIQMLSKKTGESTVKDARIMATGWGTAVEGMKSAAKIGFGFIAFTFAADLASKIIFSSHETKKAVVSDLFDIRKAGIGAAGGLAAGLALGVPKLRELGLAAGGGAGIAAGLRALSAGALKGKAGIALLLASVLGLQAAGVRLEPIFNVAFGLLGARALLSALAVKKIGTAATVAAVETGVATTAMDVEITGVGLAAKKASFDVAGMGLAGAGAGARFGALRVVLSRLVWPIALAVGAESLLTKLRPVKTLLGTIDKFFAQHIDKHIPFIGDARARADAAAAAKNLGDGAEKLKKATNKTDDDLFKLLGAGLPDRVVKAAQQLRDAGNEYGAEQLLALERTKEQAKNVKQAVDYLRSHGNEGLARILDPLAKQITAAKHQFDALFGNIDTSILNAFDAHTSRMLDAFDTQTSKAEAAFDKQTRKLEENLKVTVSLPNLNERFTVTVTGKTPAEKELDALDKVEAKRNSQRGIFDARKDLSLAFQVGDPAAIRDAQRKLEDAEAAKRRVALDARAKKERAAADAALDKGKTALDDKRQGGRDNLAARRDSERRDLEAQRAVEHAQIEAALKAQQTMYDNGKIGLKQYYKNILAIMSGHKVSLAQAGKDGGKAYAEQMQGYFDRLEKTISRDLKSITDKAKTTAGALKKVGGLEGLLGPQAQAIVAGITGANAGQPPVTGPEATSGLPTRPAMLTAIRKLGHVLGAPTPDQLEKLLPQRGRPTQEAYDKFLRRLPNGYRDQFRSLLQREGYFNAATGAVVPGRGTGDTVAAMLTPGEVILNRRQQGHLSQMLGIDGASPKSLFAHIASGIQRFAGGGVVAARRARIDRYAEQISESRHVPPGLVKTLQREASRDPSFQSDLNASLARFAKAHEKAVRRDFVHHVLPKLAHDADVVTTGGLVGDVRHGRTKHAGVDTLFLLPVLRPLRGARAALAAGKAVRAGEDAREAAEAAYRSTRAGRRAARGGRGRIRTYLDGGPDSPHETFGDAARRIGQGFKGAYGRHSKEDVKRALFHGDESLFGSADLARAARVKARTHLRRLASEERGELGFGVLAGALGVSPRRGGGAFIARSSQAHLLPENGPFLYHGTSTREAALSIARERKVRATAAERSSGQAPPGAFFTGSAQDAAFYAGSKGFISVVPRRLVRGQVRPVAFGRHVSDSDVTFGAPRPKQRSRDIIKTRKWLDDRTATFDSNIVQIPFEFEPHAAVSAEKFRRYGGLSFAAKARDRKQVLSHVGADIHKLAEHFGLTVAEIRSGLGIWRGQKNVGAAVHLRVPKGGWTPEFEKKVRGFTAGLGHGLEQGSVPYGRPLAADAKGHDVFPAVFWDGAGKDPAALGVALDKISKGGIGVTHSPTRNGYYLINYALKKAAFEKKLAKLGVHGSPLSWQGNYLFNKHVKSYAGAGAESFQKVLGGNKEAGAIIEQMRRGLELARMPKLDSRKAAENLRDKVDARNLFIPKELRTKTGALSMAKVERAFDAVEQEFVGESGYRFADWYKRRAMVLRTVAEQEGMSPAMIARISAEYSPNMSPQGEIDLLIQAIDDYKRGGKVRPHGMTSKVGARKVNKILDNPTGKPGERGTAKKVYSYGANSLEKLSPLLYKYFYGAEQFATIDLHATRLGLPKLVRDIVRKTKVKNAARVASGLPVRAWNKPKIVPGRGYELLEAIDAEAAAQLGYSADEFQAGAWVPVRARNELGRPVGIPTGSTYESLRRASADAGESKILDIYGPSIYNKLLGKYQQEGLGSALRLRGARRDRPFERAGSGARVTEEIQLARLDRAYNALVEKIIPESSPYGGKLSRQEQARRNYVNSHAAKGTRRLPTVKQEEFKLAEAKLDEMLSKYPGNPTVKRVAALVAERDALRRLVNQKAEKSIFGSPKGFATGGWVPGHGSRDTVRAMLTPGEIVLNEKQQKRLRSMLGLLGGSARDLFDFVAGRKTGRKPRMGRKRTDIFPPGDSLAPNGRGIRHDLLDRHPGKVRGWRNDDRNGLNWPNQPPPWHPKQHLADGGVVGFASGGSVSDHEPTLPGFGDLGPSLKKLIAALTKSAVAQQNFIKDPKLSAIFSGVGTTGDGGITKKLSADKQRKLRATLAPPHIESLVAKDPTLAALPLAQKKQVEQQLARMQAHPYNSGLATPTSISAVPHDLRPPAERHQLPNNREIPNGGSLFTGPITIQVNGGSHTDGYRYGQEIRRGLQAHGERNANVRSGMRGGSKIGLG